MRFASVASILIVSGCFDPGDVEGTDTENASGSTAAESGASSGGAEDSSGAPADSSGAGSESGAVVDGCPDYCSLVTDHCQDANAQYSGSDACEAVCASIPPGLPRDELGNTVGCRTYHAIVAAEGPDEHCQHAGPAGGGVCGGNCESFCSLAASLCTGDLAQWDDLESCLTDCGAFPDTVPFSTAEVAGDTYACRLYHLTVAAIQPETHCPHIGLVSEVCFPPD